MENTPITRTVHSQQLQLVTLQDLQNELEKDRGVKENFIADRELLKDEIQKERDLVKKELKSTITSLTHALKKFNNADHNKGISEQNRLIAEDVKSNLKFLTQLYVGNFEPTTGVLATMLRIIREIRKSNVKIHQVLHPASAERTDEQFTTIDTKQNQR